MFCRKCGKQALENSKFCSGCGTAFNEEAVTQEKTEKPRKKLSLKLVLACVLPVMVVVACLNVMLLLSDKKTAGSQDDIPTSAIVEDESDSPVATVDDESYLPVATDDNENVVSAELEASIIDATQETEKQEAVIETEPLFFYDDILTLQKRNRQLLDEAYTSIQNNAYLYKGTNFPLPEIEGVNTRIAEKALEMVSYGIIDSGLLQKDELNYMLDFSKDLLQGTTAENIITNVQNSNNSDGIMTSVKELLEFINPNVSPTMLTYLLAIEVNEYGAIFNQVLENGSVDPDQLFSLLVMTDIYAEFLHGMNGASDKNAGDVTIMFQREELQEILKEYVANSIRINALATAKDPTSRKYSKDDFIAFKAKYNSSKEYMSPLLEQKRDFSTSGYTNFDFENAEYYEKANTQINIASSKFMEWFVSPIFSALIDYSNEVDSQDIALEMYKLYIDVNKWAALEMNALNFEIDAKIYSLREKMNIIGELIDKLDRNYTDENALIFWTFIEAYEVDSDNIIFYDDFCTLVNDAVKVSYIGLNVGNMFDGLLLETDLNDGAVDVIISESSDLVTLLAMNYEDLFNELFYNGYKEYGGLMEWEENNRLTMNKFRARILKSRAFKQSGRLTYQKVAKIYEGYTEKYKIFGKQNLKSPSSALIVGYGSANISSLDQCDAVYYYVSTIDVYVEYSDGTYAFIDMNDKILEGTAATIPRGEYDWAQYLFKCFDKNGVNQEQVDQFRTMKEKYNH